MDEKEILGERMKTQKVGNFSKICAELCQKIMNFKGKVWILEENYSIPLRANKIVNTGFKVKRSRDSSVER